MQSFATQLFIGYFGKKVVNALAKKGITPIRSVALPDANGSYLNSDVGYCINDNGTHRIKLYSEIVALAK
jgi:hypothetical protein